MSIDQTLLKIAAHAKETSHLLRRLSTQQKNEALLAIAEELENSKKNILEANHQDLDAASHLSDAMRDRLSLIGRIDAIISDVRNVARLPDPIGEILEATLLDNGLKLQKKRVPIGVIAAIYEARPNVTIDIATLTLKTGNSVILRGGKETLTTNIAIVRALQAALKKTGIAATAIQLIESTHRSDLQQLVKLDDFIDLVIPRGGENLHRFCREESTIPIITGGMGICHLFVDETAEMSKAIEVIFNAKTGRPTVCNALDTLLLHKKVAEKILPAVIARLSEKNVCFHLDRLSQQILQRYPCNFEQASEEDWRREWLSLNLGIKVVDSLTDAVAHIQKYGTHHSDGILTESKENAHIFVESVDSAAVYVNASTRFTDGGEFGLGAEVAISTQKLHARGPMGLKELTSYKWIIEGNYHVRT